MTHLSEQIERTTGLLQGLTAEQAAFRPTPIDWSVKEVVAHLCDSERIFSYRALRIARADPTLLSGFEQEPYVVTAESDIRPLADLLAEFAAVRQSTLWLFRSLPPVAWDRRGVASDVPVSVRALAYIIAGHENHHVRSLKAEYLSPRPG
ncbi:MAG: DinB family protein [Herpetosiphonaceae bacterium]|nr:DinB family protein [Herpetosiphonaceae bacterium]